MNASTETYGHNARRSRLSNARKEKGLTIVTNKYSDVSKGQKEVTSNHELGRIMLRSRCIEIYECGISDLGLEIPIPRDNIGTKSRGRFVKIRMIVIREMSHNSLLPFTVNVAQRSILEFRIDSFLVRDMCLFIFALESPEKV